MAIFVSLISGFFALGGVFLSSILNTKQVQEERRILYQSKLIDQRVIIIDRAANIFGKSPGIQDIWQEYLKNLGSGDFNSPLVEKLAEFQGEFQSVIMLAYVYFGPKTRSTLEELSDIQAPWWMKPKEKQDNFIAAMAEEINF